MPNSVIIGLHWLAEKNILLATQTKSLVWPEELQPTAQYSRTIDLANHASPQINPVAQRDMEQRDRLWQRTILKRPPESSPILATLEVKSEPTDRPKNIPIPTNESPEEARLIRNKLPQRLAHLAGFFSKSASNELPEYRGTGNDVVLELEKPLPITTPPLYSCPPHLRLHLKETVDDLLAKGFIRPCKHPFAVPILFAPKPNGDLRFCCDYRYTNPFLKDKNYPAPALKETLQQMAKAQYFTKVDIRQAFHRLRIAPGNEWLTAFKTRYGTFEWLVLPFGLKVGPAWFQGFINDQLRDLLDRTTSAYADDCAIYSEDLDQHFRDVEEVIHRLHAAGLQGDIRKSEFAVKEISYLGLIITAGKGV